ncbi:YkyA family protein [uncultured Granulicatella sp.]|uniref:YkyA family protein n=1 Tax=uncultured Granulicatella sp. TaxID=316089 RepID=UPI00263551B4|nr:YkyA family protein [uncultured Granulicatella sp.]
MKKIAAKVFLISAGFLFLGACVNTKKSAESTVQEVQDTLPVVVQQLNDIQSLEISLQSDWEADIQEDYTMKNYSKKTGKVFTNIKERQQLLKSMQKSLKVLSDDVAKLSNLKDKNLPSAETQIVVSNLQSIVSQLKNYYELSQKQLEKEAEFFVSIAGLKQTNDELKSMIITVNNSANQRQQIIESINSPISELDRPIRILKARLSNGKGE